MVDMAIWEGATNWNDSKAQAIIRIIPKKLRSAQECTRGLALNRPTGSTPSLLGAGHSRRRRDYAVAGLKLRVDAEHDEQCIALASAAARVPDVLEVGLEADVLVE